jgi:triosephosphate isomerase
VPKLGNFMLKRKYTIFANWKMNLTLQDSLTLAKQYKKLKKPKDLEIVVVPSYPILLPLKKLFKGSHLKLAAQNSASVIKGAFTGEVSPLVLKEVGCSYVILGHSERKKYFGEDFEMISQKVEAALVEDLIPVICVGENLEERSEGLADLVVEKQVKESLSKVANLHDKKVIISYEPFWTISTSHGRIATAAEVESSCYVIKQALIDLFGFEQAEKHFDIIYGGTVNADSIDSFLQLEIVEGFLVGGASLKIDTFKQLLLHF